MISEAFATGSFKSKPVTSSSAIVIVRYEQPTEKEEHNEEEHNGEPCNEGYGGYGGAVVPVIPVPMMSGNPYMAVNLMGMTVNLLDLQNHQIRTLMVTRLKLI